jgi:hypothetical protein
MSKLIKGFISRLQRGFRHSL